MRYTDLIKTAGKYDRTLQFGATGAVLGGTTAYVLAKMLKADKAWAYGLGGAAAGGVAGGLAGYAADNTQDTADTSEALTRLRGWKLPYKTNNDEGYYTTDQIKDLQALAKEYNLEGADEFSRHDMGYLRRRLNGITDNTRPIVRYTLQKLNPEFQVAAAIHDLDFLAADGDADKALKANAKMGRNLKRIAKATGRDTVAKWTESNIVANAYKFVLDKCFRKNLQLAKDKNRRDREIAERPQQGLE